MKIFGYLIFLPYFCNGNNKIRYMDIKKKEINTIYDSYKSKATLLTDYQLCRAYFNIRGASLLDVAEMILYEKYHKPWQRKQIHKVIISYRHMKNIADKPINIKCLHLNKTIRELFTNFIEKHFAAIIIGCRDKSESPLIIRELSAII